jgi:UDP:flavonoid glycosyltransferase YjiC (YdhE family)
MTPSTGAEAEGAPPLVFTFGPQQFGRRNQNFLQVSMEAALRLGQRAVLLTGGGANRAVLPETLPKGILAVDQAWHGGLFPRASVVVNHCGVGTAAVALRAGRPQLGVPVSVDQPDNARRLVERGLALAIDDRKYTAERATKALGRLLSEPSFTRKAQEAAAAIAAEQGLERACDMLEDVLVGERRAFAAA